jgi:multidrug efflux pump subunit AcrA (membrane-fusion protein)
MNLSKRKTPLILLMLVFAFQAERVFAHEGHAEAPGAQDKGIGAIVTLSETALHNLGIQTEKAQIAEIAKTVSLNALVDALPDRTAQINSKVPSRVASVLVQSGQAVKAGAILATIQPLLVGSTTLTLVSPIEGIILKQNASFGQTTLPENILFEVGSLTEVLVRGQAYENPDLAQIKTGQSVVITSAAYPEKKFTGKIERLDAALDRATRTLEVYARVANPEALLLKNMQVTMQVETTDKMQALVVPRRALLGDGGNRFLFVKSGKDFERRDVKLGIVSGNNQEIIEGVFPDEEVVVTGQYQLQFASPAPAKEHKE